MVAQGGKVALVDQLFLGSYIVVKAGLGQAQGFGDIAQGGGA